MALRSALGGVALLAALGCSSGAPSEDTGAVAGANVEVCGQGTARAGSRAESALIDAFNDRGMALLVPHLARMHASADPLLRAASLMAEREPRPLVELARSTADPTVYAFAQQTCERTADGQREPLCSQLSAEQAAKLDPDNAVPWMDIARAAQARGEIEIVAAALERARTASRALAREFSFLDIAWSAVPESLSGNDRLALGVMLVGVQAALAVRDRSVLRRQCAQADARQRALCDAWAKLYLSRGPTLVDYWTGRRLAEQAAWPAPTIEELRADEAAYMGVMVEAAHGGGMDCAALTHGLDRALDLSRRGELAALRAAVAARPGSTRR